MSLSESKQRLSDLTKRKARVEATIGQSENALSTKVDALREIYGDRIPENPANIPFDEIADEITGEWNELELKVNAALDEATTKLTEAEEAYDVANGSSTANR